MLSRSTTLFNALVLGFAAIISWAAGPYMWGWLQPVWFLVVSLLSFAALFALADWTTERAVIHYRSLREAWTITPQLRVLDKYTNMRPELVELLMRETPVVEVLAGEPVPAFSLKLGGDSVPYDFIHLYISNGDDSYLPPVRLWAEGSRQREWAQLLTHHFCLMGFAEEAKGSRSARWIEKERALRWIGLVGGQPGMVAKEYLQA